jgi:uncharacterized protein
VLAGFLADGLEVVKIPESGTEDERAEATREAVRSGVQIIFQGVLKAPAAEGSSQLLGRPDFLIRADALPGAESDHDNLYEVVDAKLARTAKARAVLQTTFYSYLVSQLQEAEPGRMHLALGNGEFTSLRVLDYAAYERRIRALLEEFMSAEVDAGEVSSEGGRPHAAVPTTNSGDTGARQLGDLYPEPVEHCAICRWSPTCTARRRADDDLSLVAGMPVNQRVALKALDVGTRRGFASLDELPRVGRADPASLQKAHLQARLQVRSEDAGEIEYQLLEPERDADGELVANRGLLALPEPTVGDLFFDIEGARYYSEDGKEFGLQYLFGIVDTGDVVPYGGDRGSDGVMGEDPSMGQTAPEAPAERHAGRSLRGRIEAAASAEGTPAESAERMGDSETPFIGTDGASGTGETAQDRSLRGPSEDGTVPREDATVPEEGPMTESSDRTGDSGTPFNGADGAPGAGGTTQDRSLRGPSEDAAAPDGDRLQADQTAESAERTGDSGAPSNGTDGASGAGGTAQDRSLRGPSEDATALEGERLQAEGPTGEMGTPRYTQIWAFDRADEKRAFEELVDFIAERRARNPGLHVYHYNHYEPTSLDHLTELHGTREEALGRLMGRFATREDELDDLFRLGVFVDLYRVVRQAVRAGVESYSIKRLEPLVGYQRRIDLRDATSHLIAFEAALDEGTAAEEPEDQAVVAGYNEDDCRATLMLRDWLEARRPELAEKLGVELPRPVVEEPRHAAQNEEVARLGEELLANVPEDVDRRSGEEKAKALLADVLEWHRREAKPAWWLYFRLKTLSSLELVDERGAIGELRGGEIVGQEKRSMVRRFEFPPQEHGFDVGDKVCDPVTDTPWTVCGVNEEGGSIDLKIGLKSEKALPSAVIGGKPFDNRTLEASLRRLAERVVTEGLGDDAATKFLLRQLPRGSSRLDRRGGPPCGAGGRPQAAPTPGSGDAGESRTLRQEGEESAAAVCRLVSALDYGYLPIQGPPGAGKTYTAAQAILELKRNGRTVGITAPSHAVIHNLLCEVIGEAAKVGQTVRIAQRAEKDNRFLHQNAQGLPYPKILEGLDKGDFDVVAGTVFVWCRPNFAGAVDTLFVDEAGQLSLANALAVAGGARNLVLLGDPQQLAQPSQGTHPPGSGVSALEHVLGDKATMPDDAGLFLDRTWRMHPRLCDYTSRTFYEGRLHGVEGLELQRVAGAESPFAESGLYVVPVAHEGNTNSSPEEAARVAELVRSLCACSWTNKKNATRPMTVEDVLVVTPYNAQIREIEREFAQRRIGGVQVGTVDKFQGRQAPAVIYSMATSSAEDAPRGLEFLFDLHRLNVATSRAKAVAIIVASPDLVRVFCRTPRQMVLANALCRAWEG